MRDAQARRVLGGMQVAEAARPTGKPVTTGSDSRSARSGKVAPPVASSGSRPLTPPSPDASQLGSPTARTLSPPERAARSTALDADLELVRAAAHEFEEMLAVQKLMQAVAARAVHAPFDEAQRAMSWMTAMRSWLGARDPVAALLSHANRF